MAHTTLLDLLRHGEPDRLALAVPDGPELSYGRLRDLVDEAAGRLAELGVRRGDRVALVYPNGADAVVLFLAAAAVATACPLNPAYKEDEFRFYLEDTGARALLVPPGGGGAARRAAPPGTQVIEAEVDLAGRLRVDGARPGRSGRSPQGPSPDDVALVLHTSGTTSRPKRVPLRHRNLVASVEHIADTYELTDADVSLVIMPLFHVHGLVASTLSTLRTGGTVVAPRSFNPLGFWPLLLERQATWWSASPAPQRMVLARAREGAVRGARRLRFVRSCSAALPATLMAEMEDRYRVPVLQAYGMTEGSHQLASNPLPPEPRVPGTVGKGTGVTVAIMDGGEPTREPGRQGEVVVRGPNVIDGYENNPAANAESFRDGWFRTGDRGFLDERGYLHLVGRIKELINRGGEKISPLEIDEALEAHPGVKEAVSFGLPHPTWGEQVAAAVVLAEPVSARELQAWCRERLADFKVPAVIHVVEAIPRTPTGKIQRRHVADSVAGA